MMSGVPLETFWAFNKLWNNTFYYKLYLVGILLNHTTMHGSVNIKSISCKSYTIFLSLSSSTEFKYMWNHTSTQPILLRGVQRNAYYFVSSPYYYSNQDSSVGTVSRQRAGKTKNLFFFLFDSRQGHEFFCLLFFIYLFYFIFFFSWSVRTGFDDRYTFNITRWIFSSLENRLGSKADDSPLSST
jgi:hypothetical protein